MNASPTIYARDPEAVRIILQQLFTRRQAERLIAESGGSAARVLELARSRGGRSWERLSAAQRLHEQALAEIASHGPALTSPDATRTFLIRVLGATPYEVFCVLFLDNRHRLIAMSELFRGTIDGASVHPREIVREALSHNAAAALLAHNHPSGIAEPSQADELITQRVKDALSLVDVRVLDHLIVGGSACVSLAERGLV